MTTVIELSIVPGISDPFTSIHVYLNAGEQTCTVGSQNLRPRVKRILLCIFLM